jgi:hypothetical protein
MENELEHREVDSLHMEAEETTKIDYSLKYPWVRTLLALLAFAAASFTVNPDNLVEHGFVSIFMSSIIVGFMLLIPLKLIAIPCAYFVSMSSGFAFKYAYFKTLRLIYYVPYALFFIVLFFFTANYFVNAP